MGHVPRIPHHELQRVFARRKFQHDFRLPTAKMPVMLVRWQSVIQFIGPFRPLAQWRPVNQQVMVAGIRHRDALRRDAHVAQSHAHPEFAAGDDGAVVRPDEI